MTSSLPLLQRLLPSRVYENAAKYTYCCARRYMCLMRADVKVSAKTSNKNIIGVDLQTEGIGLKGQVVEVTKSEFRNHLYPKGLAIYASPENIEKYDEIRKSSRDYGIDYEMKMSLLKLSKTHIDVHMNMDFDWILDENHIRIALRKAGVHALNENIVLDKEPISNKLGGFSFWIQLKEILCVQVNGTVHPFGGTFEELESTVKDSSAETEDPEKIELLIEDENPVKYYEDIFGAKKASSDNISDVPDDDTTTAPKK